MPLYFAKAFIFMQQTELIPHLFRTEYRKIVSVLSRLFGIEHIEIAEDIVSDTFLLASELWGLKGLPENPTAWLYIVAKNKTKDYLKRNSFFAQNISKEIKYNATISEEIKIEQPTSSQINERLSAVLMTLYLLFNEGYYSSNQDITLRKDLCFEAMRLTNLLIENDQTNKPSANALLSLMCFHSSRFDARL